MIGYFPSWIFSPHCNLGTRYWSWSKLKLFWSPSYHQLRKPSIWVGLQNDFQTVWSFRSPCPMEWARVGPRVAYSAWARSLLPPPPSTSGPFYPMSLFAPTLSSSHLKRQYLTGSSSHQIRDITSYCHNAIFTRCSWSVCDHKKPADFFSLDFPLYQELS